MGKLLTRDEAEHLMQQLQARWPRAEIDWLLKLPAREQAVVLMLAYAGFEPVTE